MDKNYIYPFSATVGQEKLKKSLILNFINPHIGGLLVSGDKGTSKSTTVRAFQHIVTDMNIIEVPLNVSEDRLIGSIDIEETLKMGEKTFQCGLLKEAHENIIYIDEINLLPKALLAYIFKVHEDKVNYVEREGISLCHPSNFILIGTMNPEEGQFSKAFMDKIGLYVEVQGEKSLESRVEILRRNLQYGNNPKEFCYQWKENQGLLKCHIMKAREKMKTINIEEDMMCLSAVLCDEYGVQGHRGDIILVETAKALCAFYGETVVRREHILEAATFVLPHRMSKLPEKDHQEQIKEEKEKGSETSEEKPSRKDDPLNIKDLMDLKGKSLNYNDSPGNDETNLDEIGNLFKVRDFNIRPLTRIKRNANGKAIRTKTSKAQGSSITYGFPKGKVKDIAFVATLRAAAPYQKNRKSPNLSVVIEKGDLRENIRQKKTSTTIIFVVDASGSMAAKKRMTAVKGAILSILTNAYEKRDKVAMISFRRNKAEVLLEVTKSVELAEKKLRTMVTGGKTPLGEGLKKGYQIVKKEKLKNPEDIILMVVVSDCKGNFSLSSKNPMEEVFHIGRKITQEAIDTIVIDSETGFLNLGLGKKLSETMKGKHYTIEELKDTYIVDIIKNTLDTSH